MTDLEEIRNTIGDLFKTDVMSIIGITGSTVYALRRSKIKEDSVVVTGATLASVDYDNATITLTTAVDDVFQVTYQFSAFSDDELTAFIVKYGTVKNVALKCIEFLLADAARRYDYSTGLENVQPSQIFDHLKELRTIILEGNSSAMASGGAVFADRITEYHADKEDGNYEGDVDV
jgi:hypothetical protein